MIKHLLAAVAVAAPLMVSAQGTVECGTANSPQCGPGGHAVYPGYGPSYAWPGYGTYGYGYGVPRALRDRDGNGVVNRKDGDKDRDGVINRYDRDRDGDGVRNRRDDRPRNPYRQ